MLWNWMPERIMVVQAKRRVRVTQLLEAPTKMSQQEILKTLLTRVKYKKRKHRLELELNERNVDLLLMLESETLVDAYSRGIAEVDQSLSAGLVKVDEKQPSTYILVAEKKLVLDNLDALSAVAVLHQYIHGY